MELRELASRYPAPCLRWYHAEELNPVERLIFNHVRPAQRVLDFGAGDLRMKKKFAAAGFRGSYGTLDVSNEFEHDYRDISEVPHGFDAILCLEVIEHLPLAVFETTVGGLCDRLAPGGVIALSTPNPLCIVPMWSRDAGHISQYPLHDLLTFFLLRGFEVAPYRIRFTTKRPSIARRLRLFVQRVLCYLLAVDYADGLLVIARKPV